MMGINSFRSGQNSDYQSYTAKCYIVHTKCSGDGPRQLQEFKTQYQ